MSLQKSSRNLEQESFWNRCSCCLISLLSRNNAKETTQVQTHSWIFGPTSKSASGAPGEIPGDEDWRFRRCAAVLHLLAAVLFNVDALFITQNFADARDLYRISKAFSKVCQLPDALFKIIRLARPPSATRVCSYKFDPIYLPVLNSEPLPQAVDVWRQRFAAMGVKGSTRWQWFWQKASHCWAKGCHWARITPRGPRGS